MSSDEVEKIKHLGECFNPINIYLSLLREENGGVCKLGLLYLKRTVEEERNAPYGARWSYVYNIACYATHTHPKVADSLCANHASFSFLKRVVS